MKPDWVQPVKALANCAISQLFCYCHPQFIFYHLFHTGWVELALVVLLLLVCPQLHIEKGSVEIFFGVLTYRNLPYYMKFSGHVYFTNFAILKKLRN